MKAQREHSCKNEHLSKVDAEDEVEGEREEVEGEREGQQKRDRERIQGQGEQGQEEEGEHHSGEDMEEGEHHQDEEGESDRQDKLQGSDSERERRVPEPSPTISSGAGPHGMETVAAYFNLSSPPSSRRIQVQVPVQPMPESFPKTLQGGPRRSFRKYSQSKDAAYCFSCRHFSLPDAPRTVFTSFEGYRNWKKDTMKDSGFCSHARSEGHVNAMFAWTENKKMMDKNPSMFGLMDEQKKKQVPQKTIENEILECLAAMVKEEIIQEVKTSKQFSVIVDETKDVQKKEQMSFVLRYFYNGVVHESFLEFEVAEHLDAAALSGKIICFLEKHGLEYENNLVGQGYDGAAVMRGAHAGVQAKIKEVAKHAFCVHCSAHCLNLVIVDAVKSVADAGNFFSLLERLYVFMSGSYVHNKWLEVQREMFDGAPRELQQLSDTRWACRHIACGNVMDRLPAIVQVLEEIASENHPQRAVEVLQGTVIHSTLGQHVVPDSKHTFCVSVYYPVLDNMIGEIGRRFSNTNCNIMQGVQALNPSSPTFLREEAVLLLAEAYDSNIEDLKHELHQTRRVLDRKKGEKESPTTLMEFTQFLKPYEDVFYELFRLCNIAVVLPVSSASCEQSFSSLRLIKTYLRSTMTEKRLSSLAVLSIESKRTKALDLDTFVKRFAEQHGNRRIQLL
uniref:Zinc finger MYM-type protein 1 n=1 Tax=Dicentrarchus labrax TaxID=13489 RepID=A0A8P4KJH8_DICLA